MFISNFRKCATRDWHETHDNFNNTKTVNGEIVKNKFTNPQVVTTKWILDKYGKEKMVTVKSCFQDEIDRAITKVVNQIDYFAAGNAQVPTADRSVQDFTQIQKMSKVDLIDKIKETKRSKIANETKTKKGNGVNSKSIVVDDTHGNQGAKKAQDAQQQGTTSKVSESNKGGISDK